MAIWKGPYLFKDDLVSLAPKNSGVYKLLYKGEVVYIGSSKTSLRSRLSSHRKRKSFMKVTHFLFREANETKAFNLEVRLCREFYKQHGKLPRLQKLAPKSEIDIFGYRV